MKSLTSIALIAALSISASANASSDFWIENGDLLVRHSNQNDVSYVPGATQGDSKFWSVNSDLLVRHSNPNDISHVPGAAQANSTFWAVNSDLLERHSNPNDASFHVAVSGRIGNQPEIGSASTDAELTAPNNLFKL